MDISSATEALSALSQPTRLMAFRRLIAAHPDGLPAGKIARLCRVPHNTMSSHLAALSAARLVSSQRQGRVVTYRADLGGLRRLVVFLTRECCGGRADICAPLLADILDPCRLPAANLEARP
jgi:ArsR family transcriptional regulator, arsenate/arsenite/antimonite-responsive transcriptional repressor